MPFTEKGQTGVEPDVGEEIIGLVLDILNLNCSSVILIEI